uniref:Uncharacterized protein n=1 Tax=Acrobeloides nanus TaxID=290746 RepID=A0A914DIS2_9BILA
MTFNLQKMMVQTLFIHTLIPLFCTILLYGPKPLALLGILPPLPTEVVTVLSIVLYSSNVLNNALTIYTIKPYRRHLATCLMRFFNKHASTTTATVNVQHVTLSPGISNNTLARHRTH